MSRTNAAILAIVVAGVLFGTAGTAGALGPAGTTPLGVGAVRLIGGAIALLVALPLLGRRPRRVLGLCRRPPVMVAALGAAGFQLCFFAAVERTGVATGTLVTVGSSPILTGLLGWVVLGQRLTPAWFAATLVCICGLVMLSWGEIGGGDPLGLLLALAAGLAIATYTVGTKRVLDRGESVIEVPTASFTLGGLLLVPVLLSQPLGWLTQPSGVVLAVYLGLATMALANVMLARGIEGLPPAPVNTLVLTDPLVATLLGVVVLDETLGPVAWMGLLVVFCGLMLQAAALARTREEPAEPLPVL